MNQFWFVWLPTIFPAILSVFGEVLKENDASPNGWKVVTEPVGEPELTIKGNANRWNTEWTTRSLGRGKKIGAVPDFLQELNSEYHGPDFDYFASSDNSNEKADESDYHFKTPFDSHDHLSHHQNPKTVPMTSSNGWLIPHTQEMKAQTNDPKFKKTGQKKSGQKVKPPVGTKSSSKSSENKKSKEKVSKLIKMVDKPKRPASKKEESNGLSANDPHAFLEQEDDLTERKSRDSGTQSNMTGRQAEKGNMPLENIVKGLVTGVQDILQLKKEDSEPSKGTWALSYNSSQEQGKNNTNPFTEDNTVLLKFNNTHGNQEDLSLTFHKGRTPGKSENDKRLPLPFNAKHRPKLPRITGIKQKRDKIHKSKKRTKGKVKLVQSDQGWSVTQGQKKTGISKLKGQNLDKKTKEHKVKKSKSKFKTKATGPPSKTILPTDEGWSVFDLNSTNPKTTIKLKPRIIKKPVWVVDNKQVKPAKIISSEDGWVESFPNKPEPKQEELKKAYTRKFEPAKIVTVPKINVTERIKPNKVKSSKADVNENLLKDSNKAEDNPSLLEDDKEQIQRNLNQGDAINMKNKNIEGLGEVKKLKKEEKDDDVMSIKEGQNKIGNVMETIRKAGLDSPKNVKKVNPPKPKHSQETSDQVDNILDRSSEVTTEVAEGGEKDENKTSSEANLQASLHESLQSAMSGIVKVFNDKVDVHSDKETVDKEADRVVEHDQMQRDIPAPTAAANKLDFSSAMWTPWSQWGSCSVSCGRGWITRRRFCLTVTRKCEGRAIEMKFCHMKPCPEEIMRASDKTINPQGEWSPWSPCSVSCGEGWTVRRKICYGRFTDRCSGPMVDIKRCRNHRRCISPLRKKLHTVRVQPVGEQVTWSEWSSCSATCGRGWKMRTRECDITNLNKCTEGRYDIEKCSVQSCKTSKGKTGTVKIVNPKKRQRIKVLEADSRQDRESDVDSKTKPVMKTPPGGKTPNEKKPKDNNLIANMDVTNNEAVASNIKPVIKTPPRRKTPLKKENFDGNKKKPKDNNLIANTDVASNEAAEKSVQTNTATPTELKKEIASDKAVTENLASKNVNMTPTPQETPQRVKHKRPPPTSKNVNMTPTPQETPQRVKHKRPPPTVQRIETKQKNEPQKRPAEVNFSSKMASKKMEKTSPHSTIKKPSIKSNTPSTQKAKPTAPKKSTKKKSSWQKTSEKKNSKKSKRKKPSKKSKKTIKKRKKKKKPIKHKHRNFFHIGHKKKKTEKKKIKGKKKKPDGRPVATPGQKKPENTKNKGKSPNEKQGRQNKVTLFRKNKAKTKSNTSKKPNQSSAKGKQPKKKKNLLEKLKKKSDTKNKSAKVSKKGNDTKPKKPFPKGKTKKTPSLQTALKLKKEKKKEESKTPAENAKPEDKKKGLFQKLKKRPDSVKHKEGHKKTAAKTTSPTRGPENPATIAGQANAKASPASKTQGAPKKVAAKAPVTKVWSKWSAWSDCSVTCGTGIQSRIRTCTAVFPDGKTMSTNGCPGEGFETRKCTGDPCDPLDSDGILVPEGYQAKLKCPYKPSNDVAQIHWITPKGQEINDKTLDMRYLVKGSVLYIKHSRKKDRGVYHCLVSGKKGQIIETLAAKLIVQTCKDNFCQNGGRCLEVPASKQKPYRRVVCNCADGFTGRFCSHSKNASEKKITPITKDKKVLVILVILIFLTVVAICWLLLCCCGFLKRRSDEVKEAREAKEENGPEKRPLLSDVDNDQPESVYEEISPPKDKHRGSKQSVRNDYTFLNESKTQQHGGKKDKRRFRRDKGPPPPPSKSEIEAAERQSRASEPRYTKRPLPPAPRRDTPTDDEFRHITPLPDVSSGYLQPTNKNPQLQGSMPDYPMGDMQGSMPSDEKMLQYPSFQVVHERPQPLEDSNVGTYEPIRSAYVPQSYQNTHHVSVHNMENPQVFTSTPVASPIDSAPPSRQNSRVSPLRMHPPTEDHGGGQPSEVPDTRYDVGIDHLTGQEGNQTNVENIPTQKPIDHKPSPVTTDIPEFRRSNTEIHQPYQPMYYQPSPRPLDIQAPHQQKVEMCQQYYQVNDLPSPIPVERIQVHRPNIESNMRHQPRNYQASPTSLANYGRVSPPIRAKIADLEVALGFRSSDGSPLLISQHRIGPKASPPAYPTPQPKARGTGSFEDSFTGLKESKEALVHGQPIRSLQTSHQSLGDYYTGQKEIKNSVIRERSPTPSTQLPMSPIPTTADETTRKYDGSTITLPLISKFPQLSPTPSTAEETKRRFEDSTVTLKVPFRSAEDRISTAETEPIATAQASKTEDETEDIADQSDKGSNDSKPLVCAQDPSSRNELILIVNSGRQKAATQKLPTADESKRRNDDNIITSKVSLTSSRSTSETRPIVDTKQQDARISTPQDGTTRDQSNPVHISEHSQAISENFGNFKRFFRGFDMPAATTMSNKKIKGNLESTIALNKQIPMSYTETNQDGKQVPKSYTKKQDRKQIQMSYTERDQEGKQIPRSYTETNQDGKQIQMSYTETDQDGEQIPKSFTETNQDGKQIQMSYTEIDQDGEQIPKSYTETNQDGRQIQMSCTETEQDGEQIPKSYTETNQDGRQIQMSYTETEQDGEQIPKSYTETDRDGRQIQMSYTETDQDGEQIPKSKTETNQDRNQIQMSYTETDQDRRQIPKSYTETDQDGRQIQMSYTETDQDGKQIPKSYTETDQDGRQIQMSYTETDQDGEQIPKSYTETDQDGRQIQMSYTERDQDRNQIPISYTETNPDGKQIQISYTERDQDRRQIPKSYIEANQDKNQIQMSYTETSQSRNQIPKYYSETYQDRNQIPISYTEANQLQNRGNDENAITINLPLASGPDPNSTNRTFSDETDRDKILIRPRSSSNQNIANQVSVPGIINENSNAVNFSPLEGPRVSPIPRQPPPVPPKPSLERMSSSTTRNQPKYDEIAADFVKKTMARSLVKTFINRSMQKSVAQFGEIKSEESRVPDLDLQETVTPVRDTPSNESQNYPAADYTNNEEMDDEQVVAPEDDVNTEEDAVETVPDADDLSTIVMPASDDANSLVDLVSDMLDQVSEQGPDETEERSSFDDSGDQWGPSDTQDTQNSSPEEAGSGVGSSDEE